MSFFNFATRCLGIDLGTDSILVAMKGVGIIINEPTVVALDKKTGTLLETGRKAKEMLERHPDKIEVIRPLKGGVIADLRATELMLKDIMKRINKKYGMARTEVVLGVPSGITEVEKRAAQEAVYDAGARAVYLIDEPLAAAIGVGIDIGQASGNLVIDIGRGTTEVAVISLGGIVVSNSMRLAGEDIDKNIVEYVRKNRGLEISNLCAENIKKEIGAATPGIIEVMDIKGRDIQSGFPKTIEIDSEEVLDATVVSIAKIIAAIKLIIEKTPPELVADITANGIILTGGNAQMKRMDDLIYQKTGIRTYLVDEPERSVVNGTEKTLENIELMKILKAKRRR